MPPQRRGLSWLLRFGGAALVGLLLYRNGHVLVRGGDARVTLRRARVLGLPNGTAAASPATTAPTTPLQNAISVSSPEPIPGQVALKPEGGGAGSNEPPAVAAESPQSAEADNNVTQDKPKDEGLSGFGILDEVGNEDEANGIPELIERMNFTSITQHTGWTQAMLAGQLALLQQCRSGANVQEFAARLTREGFPVGGAKAEGEAFVRREKCKALGGASPPWSKAEVFEAFREFLGVYLKRIVGFFPRQRVDHSFWMWFNVRRLQPKYVIETSCKWGHATYLIRHAAPKTKIIAFSPTGLQLKHWDKEARYYVGPVYQRPETPPGIEVSPFVEFNETDWSFITDKRDALVIFADDRDHWLQFQALNTTGFKKAIFDENMAPLQGYRYSLKKICDETGGLPFKPWKYRDDLVIRSSRKSGRYEHSYISLQQHRAHRQELLQSLRLYIEMPPFMFYPAMLTHSTFHLPTNTPGNRVLVYLTVSTVAPPLVQTQEEFDALGIRNIPLREFWFYRNPAYVELH